jgi:peptidoglycan/xylan/chitin deacetylase (PgdA/CDA1 family)
MLGFFKTSVKKLLYYGGYYGYKSRRATRDYKRLLVLMYHDFAPDDVFEADMPPLQEMITPAQFEAHLKILKSNYRVTTVEKAVEEIKYGGGLKENSVAITFDDGYVSVYDLVFPLLKKYACPATVYLPTDWINGRIKLWWDDFADMVQAADLERLDFEKINGMLNEQLPQPLEAPDNGYFSRRNFFEMVSFALMQLPDDKRLETTAELKQLLLGEADYEKTEHYPLSWEQIKELAEFGVQFGAHTCSHINMSHTDPAVTGREIAASKAEIESRLGREIKGFAYPYGYDPPGYERFVPLLKELGFDYACTSWWGYNREDTDLYLLFRNSLPLIMSPSLLGRDLHINMTEDERPPYFT